MLKSISSRSLTRADEKGSDDNDLASAIVDVVAFRRVWNRIKPIPRSTTDKCSEHNPKIGPLTDLHTRWHSSYFSYKRSSYKSTGSTLAIFDWFDWWTNQMYFTLTFLPVTCHMSHVIHFEFSLSEEKICAKFVLFVFTVFICFSATVFEHERKKVLRGSIWKW